MKQAAIVCENLTFRYFEKSKPVIDKASLTIPAGEITVLMGSSGCGKSTLAAILCGLLPENGGFLTEGSIELFGTPLKQLRVRNCISAWKTSACRWNKCGSAQSSPPA